jgi:signal transduction histidine kinase
VADVSRAVNFLTESLNLHVLGMKELLANMSHELKSSVSGLSMSLEILDGLIRPELERWKIQPAQKGKILENMDQARLESDLLASMVDSGLLAGKLDFRHESVEMAPLDFSSLCQETLSRHSLRASLKKVGLEWEATPNLWLMGDELLLDRLLSNLLDNALKYTEPGGRIQVSLKEAGERILLKCQNTHHPLGAEQLSSLFSPFYRVDQGKAYGVGLGLYLVRKITLLHDGLIDVSNTENGISFLVSFPVPPNSVPKISQTNA